MRLAHFTINIETKSKPSFFDKVETVVPLSFTQLLVWHRYYSQGFIHEMENILTALRLLKEGDVGTTAYFEKEYISSWTQSASSNVPLRDHRIRESGSLYMLNETELPKVENLFKDLQKLNTQQSSSGTQKLHGDLTVALRRFNQAYGRDIHEDQIIDLTIALESCLLTENEELTYRLSLRGAALLAQGKTWEPNKAQSLLKTIYAIRSAIVHNGQQLSDLGKEPRKMLQKLGIQPLDFPQHCENIVRDILKAYVMRLARGGSVQTVIKELDSQIVGSLALQSATEV